MSTYTQTDSNLTGVIYFRLIPLVVTAFFMFYLNTIDFLFVLGGIGLTHYILAFWYSRFRVYKLFENKKYLLLVVPLIGTAICAYYKYPPLIYIFAAHHLINEAYYFKKFSYSIERPKWLFILCMVFHGLIYYCISHTLRINALEHLQYHLIALGLLGFGYFYGLYKYSTKDSWKFFVSELMIVALLGVNFFTHTGFLSVVFYHFAFWYIFPLKNIKGVKRLNFYILQSSILTALSIYFIYSISAYDISAITLKIAPAFGILGVGGYLHILYTLVLSDMNPKFLVSLQKNA